MNLTRIVLCTNGGLPGAVVLERLLACKRAQVVGVVRSSRVMRVHYGRWRGAWEHYRRSGLGYTLYLGCMTSLADALAGHSAVATLVGERRLPVISTADVNGGDGRAFLEQVQPDLLVTAFFNQRVGTPVAAMPRAGAINIHPSLLPDFKGVDPVFFARLNDSPALGVTLHRITRELDCGNILAQHALPVVPSESAMRTTARLFRHGADLLTASLDTIVHGDKGQPQPNTGRYDSWPSRPQVRAFRRKGKHLVDIKDLIDLSRGRLME